MYERNYISGLKRTNHALGMNQIYCSTVEKHL